MRPRNLPLATLCTTLLCASSACAQLSTAWLTQYGTNGTERGFGIAVDSTGQGWVTGFTTGNLGGGGNAGGNDFFLSRISPAGSVLSTAQRGTLGSNESNAVALLGNTSIFIGGGTTGALDGQPNQGGYDNVVLRHTSSGVWQNTVTTGSPANDFIMGLAANSTNVFSAGWTDGSYAAQTNAGSADAFITKMDATGTPIWTNFLGTSSIDRAEGIAVDSAGNSYVTGFTGGTLPGLTSSGGSDSFVAKYDPSGNRTLLIQRGGTIDDEANAIRVDASGNIYLTGYTTSDLDGQTNNGQQDAFLTKLDSTGNLLWTRLFGGTGVEYGISIDLDSTGHIWIGGSSNGDLADHVNVGNTDGFILRYDPDGNLLDTYYLATTGDDSVNSIAAAPDGSVEITGSTDGNLGGTNAGSSDVFVAKIVPEPGVCGLLIGAIGVLGMGRLRGRRG